MKVSAPLLTFEGRWAISYNLEATGIIPHVLTLARTKDVAKAEERLIHTDICKRCLQNPGCDMTEWSPSLHPPLKERNELDLAAPVFS